MEKLQRQYRVLHLANFSLFSLHNHAPLPELRITLGHCYIGLVCFGATPEVLRDQPWQDAGVQAWSGRPIAPAHG